MARSPRRAILAAATAAIAALGGSGALAWACTAEPMISVAALVAPDGAVTTVRPGQNVVVLPDSETTVQVVNYADRAPGQVEIRWDSLDGPLVGRSDRLAVPVHIPSAEPGVHHLAALFRAEDGRVMSKASTAVRVAGPTSASDLSAWGSPVPASPSPQGTPLSAGFAILSVGLVTAVGAAAAMTIRRKSQVSVAARP